MQKKLITSRVRLPHKKTFHIHNNEQISIYIVKNLSILQKCGNPQKYKIGDSPTVVNAIFSIVFALISFVYDKTMKLFAYY